MKSVTRQAKTSWSTLVNGQCNTAGDGAAAVLFEIVGDLGEVAGRGLGPTDTHLARIPALNAPFDFVLIDELAAIGRGDAFFDFTDEPLIVVHHALHGLDHQHFAVTALLRCELRELRL